MKFKDFHASIKIWAVKNICLVQCYHWPALQPSWWSRHSQSTINETGSSQCPENDVVCFKRNFFQLFMKLSQIIRILNMILPAKWPCAPLWAWRKSARARQRKWALWTNPTEVEGMRRSKPGTQKLLRDYITVTYVQVSLQSRAVLKNYNPFTSFPLSQTSTAVVASFSSSSPEQTLQWNLNRESRSKTQHVE